MLYTCCNDAYETASFSDTAFFESDETAAARAMCLTSKKVRDGAQPVLFKVDVISVAPVAIDYAIYHDYMAVVAGAVAAGAGDHDRPYWQSPAFPVLNYRRAP